MSLVAVEEAQARLLAGVAPLPIETAALREARGRTLAEPLSALRTQPPFDASAMDGYAVRAADAATPGAVLKLVGEARAGTRYSGTVGAGEAVRIFTGAPVPDGADAILIQEDARRDGDAVTIVEGVTPGIFIRPAGLDFRAGDVLIEAGRVLDARALSLAAAMNRASLPVRRRPVVAILSTGDELVEPGAEPGPDQIVSSNGVGLSALVEEAGGTALDLGIAPDTFEAIAAAVGRAREADILVTAGGASVGEHDLVQDALARIGMRLDFWRIAMRPGKPLMVGRLGESRFIGLPGNPVSALVCGLVFLKPLILKMLGRDAQVPLVTARLGTALGANDRRQDYLRARLERDGAGLVATPFGRQDSSMLATFAASGGLIVRAPHAPAADRGAIVEVLPLHDLPEPFSPG